MLQVTTLSDSDIFILASTAAVICSVLGLLSDVVMGDKGLGPMRNAFVIFAGGLCGVALRDAYYPVAKQMLLITSSLAAIAAATVALIAASLVKRFAGG